MTTPLNELIALRDTVYNYLGVQTPDEICEWITQVRSEVVIGNASLVAASQRITRLESQLAAYRRYVDAIEEAPLVEGLDGQRLFYWCAEIDAASHRLASDLFPEESALAAVVSPTFAIDT